MKKQTAAAGKGKAKKATAGERHIAKWTSQTIQFVRNDENSIIEAAEFDRAIAAAVRKAVKAERERCVAWVEQLIKDNEDIIRKLGHSQRRIENEHSIEDLALVRSHIKSGEKLP
jgi:hypothetical protein